MSLKTALFFMMDQYADWEGSYLASQLNQSKQWSVKTGSVAETVSSLGGFQTQIDYQIDNQVPQIDLLVLIGGNAWSTENENLRALVASRLKHNQPVAAICGAVDYLARNGLLTGYRHTGNAQYLWRQDKEYVNGQDFAATQVVTDCNLVTANGTAALAFTNQVLKMIAFLPSAEVDKATDLYQLGFYQYCKQYGNPFF